MSKAQGICRHQAAAAGTHKRQQQVAIFPSKGKSSCGTHMYMDQKIDN